VLNIKINPKNMEEGCVMESSGCKYSGGKIFKPAWFVTPKKGICCQSNSPPGFKHKVTGDGRYQ
jgi:hypothetical protein